MVAQGHGNRASILPIRGWTDEEWTAAAARLEARGWLDRSGGFTAEGRQARRAIEAHTDRLAAEPARRLGPDGVAELVRLMEPYVTLFHERGRRAGPLASTPPAARRGGGAVGRRPRRFLRAAARRCERRHRWARMGPDRRAQGVPDSDGPSLLGRGRGLPREDPGLPGRAPAPRLGGPGRARSRGADGRSWPTGAASLADNDLLAVAWPKEYGGAGPVAHRADRPRRGVHPGRRARRAATTTASRSACSATR